MVKTHFRVATKEEVVGRKLVEGAMALDLFEDNCLIMTIFPDFYCIDEEIIKRVYYNYVKEDMYLNYAPASNC